jgi:hypothetical protein
MSNSDTGIDFAVPEKLRGPLVRQFVIYLDNKVGALLDLTRTLGAHNIHICGISIVDTADAAVVRVVVDDPDRCRDVLKSKGIPAKENPVIVVRVAQGLEKLEDVLRALVEAEVNLDYLYALFIQQKNHTLIAIHCEDPGYARFAMERMGMDILTQADISR